MIYVTGHRTDIPLSAMLSCNEKELDGTVMAVKKVLMRSVDGM